MKKFETNQKSEISKTLNSDGAGSPVMSVVDGGVNQKSESASWRKEIPACRQTGETNPKSEIRNAKQYDLEDRTLSFARNVRGFVKLLPRSIHNQEDSRQLIRSSGSIGANYREANDAISRKDFLYRIRIARKEAKETEYWLQLIDCGSGNKLEEQRLFMVGESRELMMILGAILRNSQNDNG